MDFHLYALEERAMWRANGRGTPVMVRIVGRTLCRPIRYDVEGLFRSLRGQRFVNVEPGHLTPLPVAERRRFAPLSPEYRESLRGGAALKIGGLA